MAKKKQEEEKDIEQKAIVPADENENVADSDTGPSDEAALPAGNPELIAEEPSLDDLFDEVRQSLVTEEVEQTESKKSKWWNRLGKGVNKRDDVDSDMTPASKADSPQAERVETFQPAVETVMDNSDQFVEEIDELIDLLEEETKQDTSLAKIDTTSTEKAEVPEKKDTVSFDELKKRAFGRQSSEKEEESISAVRSVALDEDEDVFVEVETAQVDPVLERWQAVENALLPYRRYINFAALFLGGVILVVLALSLLRSYQGLRLAEAPVPTPTLPYPVTMNLPGGLSFRLGKGELDDGRWDPAGPEWLVGTEVCRWVAIPYSRQLEAVVRTLSRDDVIELIMSNNDKLEYDVYSITQLSIADMQKLDAGSPCLLLVLAQPDTESRWVVTAKP